MSRKAPITVLLDLDVIRQLEEKSKTEDKPLSQVLRETVDRGLIEKHFPNCQTKKTIFKERV